MRARSAPAGVSAYPASGSASTPAGGASAKTWRGRDARPQPVHPALRVAHRHRLPGVPVVAPAPGQQPALGRGRPSSRTPVLQAHLHRDLDRHATRSRPRNTCSGAASGGDLHQPGFASRTAGSCVSPPNITWLIRPSWLARGLVQHRVVVAVHRRPPGRHPVHQLALPRDAVRPSRSRTPHADSTIERLLPAGHRARTGARRARGRAPAVRRGRTVRRGGSGVRTASRACGRLGECGGVRLRHWERDPFPHRAGAPPPDPYRATRPRSGPWPRSAAPRTPPCWSTTPTASGPRRRRPRSARGGRTGGR
ncbi:hypothetical protein SBADM41S_02322 [Streptomyces badius]